MIKLKFKKASMAFIMFSLGCITLLLPFIFFVKTNLFIRGHYFWLIYFELLFLFTIIFMWNKIYNEVIIAKIENGVLYYRNLFFIKKSIRIDKIRGYKIGREESDFIVLYDNYDKKIFLIRMDFYSNFYDFIEHLGIKEIGIYHTVFQRFIRRIFRKNV